MECNGLIRASDFGRIGSRQLKTRIALPSTWLIFEVLLTGGEDSGYHCVIAVEGIGPYSGIGSDAYAGCFASVDEAATFCSEIAEEADREDIRTVLGLGPDEP